MNPTNPTNHPKIVILDPDQDRRNYLRSVISAFGYITYCFEKETVCLDNLAAIASDLVVYENPATDKIFRFAAALRLISRELPLLILSNNHAVEEYIHTNGLAPAWILAENAKPAEIRKMISTHIDCVSGNEIISGCPLIIGNSPEIARIKKLMPELSRSRETILILGEAGTGKELLAKSIYWGSDGKNEPFVKVDAAAIGPAAAEKNSNGEHETFPMGGGFNGCLPTGAGTLFLDRIELLPADLQGNLLHFFIGESSPKNFENGSGKSPAVRIIAAADTELEPMVARGAFRKDLFYRLNVLSVAIPPLRDRREDIPLLADYFADKFCLEFRRSFFDIPSKIKRLFGGYHWPGNVAELENVVRDMVASGEEAKVTQRLGKYCRNDIRRGITDLLEDLVRPGAFDLKKYACDNKKLSMKEICRIYKTRTEEELIKKTLEYTNWNRKKCANTLNISYKSLLNKIKAYELERN